MRLDRTDDSKPTAAQILNWSSKKALQNIFKTVILLKFILFIIIQYGDIKEANKLASSISEHRTFEPFEKTESLLKVINSLFRRDQINITAKVFQSLRMVVNDEISEIWAGLKGASDIIQLGGLIQGNVLQN